MKEYKFKVKIYSEKIGMEAELPIQEWRDKGESIAKDWLRVCIQEDFKLTHGHYPCKVELECLNSDIGCIPEHYYEEV